jgi:hypothetical protein
MSAKTRGAPGEGSGAQISWNKPHAQDVGAQDVGVKRRDTAWMHAHQFPRNDPMQCGVGRHGHQFPRNDPAVRRRSARTSIFEE